LENKIFANMLSVQCLLLPWELIVKLYVYCLCVNINGTLLCLFEYVAAKPFILLQLESEINWSIRTSVTN